MFETSLSHYSGTEKTRKTATVIFSFFLQTIVLGVLMTVPLIYTEALPQHRLMVFLVEPPLPPPPPPPPSAAPPVRVTPRPPRQPREMVQPALIPREVANLMETPFPPAPVVGTFVDGGSSIEPSQELFGVIATPEPPPPMPAASAPQEPIQIGGDVAAAQLVRQVKPVYPPLARQARIQGTVRLEAVINADGVIENLTIVSGHPLLIQAALEAVKQWRYQPTLLNGLPVDVVTTVEVHFRLGR